MNNKTELAPSILSADFARLGEQLLETREGGAGWVHFDVMDGHFVPEISFGEPVIRCIRSITDQFLDVHLMVTNPAQHIPAFAEAGADGITFHYEVMPGGNGAYGGEGAYGRPVAGGAAGVAGVAGALDANPEAAHAAAVSAAREVIAQIHSLGKKAGISIKPLTPVEAVFPLLPELDMVLVMTVEPGFGGQKYIPASTDRIRALRAEASLVNPSLRIEVDGGIKTHNVHVVLEAGADTIVAGSDVYGADVLGRTRAFMKLL